MQGNPTDGHVMVFADNNVQKEAIIGAPMFLRSTRFGSLILVKLVFSGHRLDIWTKQGKIYCCLC